MANRDGASVRTAPYLVGISQFWKSAYILSAHVTHHLVVSALVEIDQNTSTTVIRLFPVLIEELIDEDSKAALLRADSGVPCLHARLLEQSQDVVQPLR